MSTERRESRRTEVALPFQWLPCAARTPAPELCTLFGLPSLTMFHGKLGELATEFSQALHEVRDPATVGALEILDAKLGIFEEVVHAETVTPPAQSVELATDGIGFCSAEPLAHGAWLGVHLVLPTAYHLVCCAAVTHCQVFGSSYRVGAQLYDMDTVAAKRLTRFIIGTR